MEDARNEIKKRKTVMGVDAQAAKRLAEVNLWVAKELRFWSLGGGALALVGFFLWYVRVQRFQDIAIKKQGNVIAPPKPPSVPEKPSSDEAVVAGLA